MARLTLICHGVTQAVRAARFPNDEAIDDQAAVVSSCGPPVGAAHWRAGPEQRALATATALAGDRGVTVDGELRDWDCGSWRGRDIAALQRDEPAGLAAWLTDAAAAPHGGESLVDLLARIAGWLDRRTEVRARTAAVTHPAILRAAVVASLGAAPAAFWRIDAQPLARAMLSHDGRRWVLQGLVPPPKDPSGTL